MLEPFRIFKVVKYLVWYKDFFRRLFRLDAFIFLTLVSFRRLQVFQTPLCAVTEIRLLRRQDGMPEKKQAAPKAAAAVGQICLGVGAISYFYCFEIPGFEPGIV